MIVPNQIRDGVFLNAADAVCRYGQKLIGKEILTEAIGEYPGGWATVKALNEDPSAPDIVINVILPMFGPMGVFDYETVGLREVLK